MFSIERLTTADAALLSKIGGVTLIESHGHSASPDTMDEYVGKSFSEEASHIELLDENNIIYAVYYNKEPAGYYKMVYTSSHPDVPIQPVTKLERIYLLKEFYDKNLGHQLLKHAIELSKAMGEKGMWLNVWKGNERAIRFYQKQGFTIVGEGIFMLTASHGNPNWVMLLKY